MEALDNLDATSTAARILRRYFLVKLLDFRREREDYHKATQQKPRSKRQFKYNLDKIELLKLNRTSSNNTAQSPRVQGRTVKARRADSQAIEDLLTIIHPEHVSCGGTRRHRSARHQKAAAKLKSRLSCARNWYHFSQRFSPGILALIPSGGDYHISTDQYVRDFHYTSIL
jgi:hypothetical protein